MSEYDEVMADLLTEDQPDAGTDFDILQHFDGGDRI